MSAKLIMTENLKKNTNEGGGNDDASSNSGSETEQGSEASMFYEVTIPVRDLEGLPKDFRYWEVAVDAGMHQMIDADYSTCYCVLVTENGCDSPRSKYFRNVGDQICVIDEKCMKSETHEATMNYLESAIRHSRSDCVPLKLTMRNSAYHVDQSMRAREGKVAASARKGLQKVLRASMAKKLSCSMELRQAIMVSQCHPLYNLIHKLGGDLFVSFVYVRDEKMNDGLFNYSEMFGKAETMLIRDFARSNGKRIRAMLGLESTILITLTLKQNVVSVACNPYLVIGSMIVHLFDGCGVVSFGSTRKGKFSASFDTRGDDRPFEGRGIFKAMVLLASEICAAGTGSRVLVAQAVKDENAAFLYKSMGFQWERGGSISDTKVEEIKGKIHQVEDDVGVQFLMPSGENDHLTDFVIDGKPFFGFHLGQRLITGVPTEDIVDEDNEDPECEFGHQILPPDVPDLPRRSPRIIEQRITEMRDNDHHVRLTNRMTEFSGLKYSQTQNRWFGWYGKNSFEEVQVAYVMRNFSKALINQCLQTSDKVCKIPASAPKQSQPTIPVYYSTLIPVYQQLGNDTCMFSAASSAFNYFGDPMAHDILTRNIISSMSVSNRLDALTSLLYNKQCRYIGKKFKRGTFNVLEDICCYPTVLVLQGSDGAINHSVTVVGCWLFDSNTKYAQRISIPMLDWCCSTDFVKVQFSNVFSATRFYHYKPKKEWNLCDNCRNGCKLPCLTRYI